MHFDKLILAHPYLSFQNWRHLKTCVQRQILQQTCPELGWRPLCDQFDQNWSTIGCNEVVYLSFGVENQSTLNIVMAPIMVQFTKYTFKSYLLPEPFFPLLFCVSPEDLVHQHLICLPKLLWKGTWRRHNLILSSLAIQQVLVIFFHSPLIHHKVWVGIFAFSPGEFYWTKGQNPFTPSTCHFLWKSIFNSVSWSSNNTSQQILKNL